MTKVVENESEVNSLEKSSGGAPLINLLIKLYKIVGKVNEFPQQWTDDLWKSNSEAQSAT